MIRIHHINCGWFQPPSNPDARVSCHCLLLEDPAGLALVDTGFGLRDVQRPLERIGQSIIDMTGPQFNEENTAIRQVERLGFCQADVKHVILTHCDPDHVGGLADFPEATVHVSKEELDNTATSPLRYRLIQFDHQPRWRPYESASRDWYGLEARPIVLGLQSEALLIPLFGHTRGHCGVAIEQGDRWALHVGDAYYLRSELETDDHPVSKLSAQRAEDDALRRTSLEHLRRLVHDHARTIDLFGYHDPAELGG